MSIMYHIIILPVYNLIKNKKWGRLFLSLTFAGGPNTMVPNIKLCKVENKLSILLFPICFKIKIKMGCVLDLVLWRKTLLSYESTYVDGRDNLKLPTILVYKFLTSI